MKRGPDDNDYFQNHPNEAKAIVQEAQSILNNVFGETDSKNTKFSKQLFDIIKQEMQDRFKHLVVPTDIVKHILKQLPAKECWRIANQLSKDYRKWVRNNVVDLYTLVAEKFSHKHRYNNTVYTEFVSRSIIYTACYVKNDPFYIVFDKDLKEITGTSVIKNKVNFAIYKNTCNINISCFVCQYNTHKKMSPMKVDCTVLKTILPRGVRCIWKTQSGNIRKMGICDPPKQNDYLCMLYFDLRVG